ncbi:MAG: hypothetical protein AB7U45_13660 [Desulfamplus sp.]
MNLFFLSLLIILSGGVAAPLLNRSFTTMKLTAVSTMIVGSIIGLIDAGSKLMRQSKIIDSYDYTASLSYLKSFTFSFQIDNLSAFFWLLSLVSH